MTIPRIVRTFPRLCMGGAENAIVQLLEHVGNTHMISTHIDGMRATDAKRLADQYTLLSGSRFLPLLEAMQQADVVHIHTINDHPLVPLAAQLSGVKLIVQTIHNQMAPQYCHWADHSIAVGDELMDLVATPSRTTVIPNGVPCPETLASFQPWSAPKADRPLRLVEMRRKDKAMRWSLAELLATGELDDLDIECQVMGFHQESLDPRLTYLGPVSNPYPTLATADFMVMGTQMETFGRTVYEAMAWGTLPVAPPIPAFTRVFSSEHVGYMDGDPRSVARQLRQHIERFRLDPQSYARQRHDNHQYVASQFGIRRMAERTTELYTSLLQDQPTVPRSFCPEDLADGDLRLFGTVVDDILDSNPPRKLPAIDHLTPAMQGIAYWLLVNRGKVQDSMKTKLLMAAKSRLGERFILNLRLGERLLETGQPTMAIPVLNAAMQQSPDNVSVIIALMDAYIQIQQPQRAAVVAQIGVQHAPMSAYLRKVHRQLQPYLPQDGPRAR